MTGAGMLNRLHPDAVLHYAVTANNDLTSGCEGLTFVHVLLFLGAKLAAGDTNEGLSGVAAPKSIPEPYTRNPTKP